MSAGRALLLVLVAAAAARAADPEAKLKEKLARVWIDHARWAKVQGARAEALDALARAREADPEAKDLERLSQETEALPEGGGEVAGLDQRREKARKSAAKLYDKLAKLKHAPEDQARFDGYLWKAIELDPSKGRLAKVVGQVKRAQPDEAGRLLVRLREADPEGDYDRLETELAQKDVALIKSPDHPMVGWISLPRGWRAKGEWPVLVAVDGAGSNFLGAARGFAKSRGSRDFIVLAPCSLSNTNALDGKKYPFYTKETLEEHDRNRIAFDLAGLEALLKVVKERYGGTEKIGITGFSGGGNLCYGWTATRPDRVLFAAPACANFSGQGLRDAEPPPDGGPPIHILTGEKDQHRDFTFGKKDSPGIEPQTDNAVAALERLGFQHVRRTMLKGVGHSPCRQQVWDFCDEVTKS